MNLVCNSLGTRHVVSLGPQMQAAQGCVQQSGDQTKMSGPQTISHILVGMALQEGRGMQ